MKEKTLIRQAAEIRRQAAALLERAEAVLDVIRNYNESGILPSNPPPHGGRVIHIVR